MLTIVAFIALCGWVAFGMTLWLGLATERRLRADLTEAERDLDLALSVIRNVPNVLRENHVELIFQGSLDELERQRDEALRANAAYQQTLRAAASGVGDPERVAADALGRAREEATWRSN